METVINLATTETEAAASAVIITYGGFNQGNGNNGNFNNNNGGLNRVRNNFNGGTQTSDNSQSQDSNMGAQDDNNAPGDMTPQDFNAPPDPGQQNN